jgi:hypothetical protein
MNFVKKHRKIADNILELAKKYPAVIRDYRKLVQYYWHYIDGGPFIPYEILTRLTQPESISRAFRKLVEEKLINVPVQTRIGRDLQEDEYRRHYRR